MEYRTENLKHRSTTNCGLSRNKNEQNEETEKFFTCRLTSNIKIYDLCGTDLFNSVDTFQNILQLPCYDPHAHWKVNSKTGESHWETIKRHLQPGCIHCADDLEAAILSYNEKLGPLNTMHSLFKTELSPSETECFFADTMPEMCRLALALPELFPHQVPLLAAGDNVELTISQEQAACLLANSFFCTFPGRNAGKSKHPTLPPANFNALFSLNRGPRQKAGLEKLKSIINYFRRVTSSRPDGKLTFRRQGIEQSSLQWSHCESTVLDCDIRSEGVIESATGLLQMDFANKYVGGGVLRTGCVQEEIRFTVCTELLVSLIFTERLQDNEVLFVVGAEQYSNYTGYGDMFTWASDHRDMTPRDSNGRCSTTLVAADATRYPQPVAQYALDSFVRELLKATSAFYEPNSKSPVGVATGNWGCGVYYGDPEFKFLLQVMAAASCGRAIRYYTFNDEALGAKLSSILEVVRLKNLTVSKIYALLLQYNDECVVPIPNNNKRKTTCGVAEFFRSKLEL